MRQQPRRELVNGEIDSVSVESQLALRTLADRELPATGWGTTSAERHTSTADDQDTEAPARSRSRWWVRVDQLALPDLDVHDIAVGLDLPNLIVVGGRPADAQGIAERISNSRRGRLRAAGPPLLPADLAAIATSLESEDVLLIESLDRMSDDALGVLADILPIQARSAEPEAVPTRSLNVLVGEGSTARHLVLNLAPFCIVARTVSDKVPEDLIGWGARYVLEWSTMLCPACAEEIKAAATVCRYCGHRIVV
jgi:hypothetical protein